MLFGKNLGGSHDASLIAIVEGNEHRHQGDKRLTATYIALKQTVHLSSATYIGSNLPDNPLLSPCEFEGQIVVEKAVEFLPDAREHQSPIFASVVAGIPYYI